jgi:tetratricopeptide (TPR) repeat protein
LPACLESVAGLFDDIVVLDTGSTDRTKEIAAQLGARVADFPWVDDFAAARNECLKHARGAWIFWMDADDRLDAENREKLGVLLGGLKDENVAFVMKCRCLAEADTGSATVVDHVRLFRNHPDIRWHYRVHEQILPALRRLGTTVRWTDVVIDHVGYVDSELRGRKRERDLRLLRLEDAEHPDDPFTLFNLGSIYHEQGQPGQALPFLHRSLERSQPGDSIVRKLYALIAQCQRRLGRAGEGLAACQAGRVHYQDDVELLFQEALARREEGDPAGAEACLLRLLTTRERDHFASVDAGLAGHKARHNLAVLYHEQGRTAEAEAQWRAALAENEEFTPAWLGLADLCLAQGRLDEVTRILGRLEKRAPDGPEMLILWARLHMGRTDFDSAVGLLEEALDANPRQLPFWILLSHALLQEGKDWPGAERALQTVLKLDPGNAQARSNLAVLQRDHGAELSA